MSVERIVSGDAKLRREEKANLKVGDVVPVDSGTGDEWKKYSPEKMDRYAVPSEHERLQLQCILNQLPDCVHCREKMKTRGRGNGEEMERKWRHDFTVFC